jgi:hypothetical protein
MGEPLLDLAVCPAAERARPDVISLILSLFIALVLVIIEIDDLRVSFVERRLFAFPQFMKSRRTAPAGRNHGGRRSPRSGRAYQNKESIIDCTRRKSTEPQDAREKPVGN